jgi:DNA invertase Pin-like site-specific DNA recombinase
LAEVEHSLISERTRAGLKAAKGWGVKFGRKPALIVKKLRIVYATIANSSFRPWVERKYTSLHSPGFMA